MRFFGILCLAAGFALIAYYSDKYVRNPTFDVARLQVRASNLNFGIGMMIIGSIFAAAGYAVAKLKKKDAHEARQLPDREPCPLCAEAIIPAAKVCPHCRRDLPENWAVARA